jgi:drug/metabolite transporter (DMT)-like permease
VGLLDAAMWAAIVVISKRVLRTVDPIAFNLIVRVLALFFILVIGVPVTAGGLWSLDFDISWTAFGYMAGMATVTWLIAFNAYYYALYHGQVSIVGPITSTDPVFTAVFSFLILGTALGGFTIGGLLLTVAGVLLITRWMGHADGDIEEPAGAEIILPGPQEGAACLVSVEGADRPGGDSAASGRAAGAEATPGRPLDDTPPAALRNIQIVGLTLITAAAWGVAPLLIEAAMDDLGGPSLWLLVLSQGLGGVIIAPLVWRRRHRIFICPVPAAERRTLVWLLLVSGLLEAVFSILFYFMIEQLGAVLTTITVAASPVFTILAGVLFLRERPGAKVLFAAAVTLAGVFLATVDRL